MKSSKKPVAKQPAGAKPKEPDDFVSVARRLETDEDKERFEAQLRKIASAKVTPKD
jgi:hypothetical protein